MTALDNPTIEQYIFYARKLDGDDIEAMNRRYQLFVDELQFARNHLYILLERDPPALLLPKFRWQRHVTQRVVHTGWIGTDALEFSLEARAHGGAFYLQIAYHSARGGTDSYTYLKPALWQPRATAGLLGESVCLHGMADQNEDAFVHGILRQYPGPNCREPLEIFCSHFPWGKLYELENKAHLLVLLYAAKGKEQARDLLDRVIPRLELHRHIGRRQWEIYEHQVRPAIEKMEQDVLNAISQVRRPTSDLSLLEEQLSAITILSQDYTSLLGKIEGCRTTIAASRRNIEAEVSQSLADLHDEIFHRHLQWIQFQEDQIQTDLNFYSVEQNQLANARQAIQTRVDVLRARKEDRLVLLLGLLGLLFAIMQAVDADLNVMIARVAVAVLAVIVFLLWYLKRRLGRSPDI